MDVLLFHVVSPGVRRAQRLQLGPIDRRKLSGRELRELSRVSASESPDGSPSALEVGEGFDLAGIWVADLEVEEASLDALRRILRHRIKLRADVIKRARKLVLY